MSSSMAHHHTRTRFYPFPYSRQIFDSRIEHLSEASGPRRRGDILVDLRLVQPVDGSRIEVVEGRPWEIIRARMTPVRLRFVGARWASRAGFFTEMEHLPQDHFARRLFDVVHMRLPGERPRYWLFADINTAGHELSLYARDCVLEDRPADPFVIDVCRRWRCRPPTPARAVARRSGVQHQYGGDPIAIRLGQRLYRQRLFIGGLHHQVEQRPYVDHVLNLCGEPNPWMPAYGVHPDDRFESKGELVDGMSAQEILDEAAWVTRRLAAGRRVLVHCMAGINRSSTVCCAALMLLEGLSAEAALARVQERHPEAKPDPYHWFLLHWLAAQPEAGLKPAWELPRHRQPPLQGALAVR
jgi:hypothetical protein